MARRHEGKVKVLGVAGRDTTEAMRAFVVNHDLEHVPHAVDGDGRVWARLGIAGQPAWVFVDGATGTANRHLGALSVQQLDHMLDRLASQ